MSLEWNYALPDGGQVLVRMLRDSDDLEAMTRLLNRAYAPLAQAGLRYVASWQDVSITRNRISTGETYVGLRDGNLVATATLTPPDASSQNLYYHSSHVASFQQFAVAPELQGRGLGSFIMDILERRAAQLGYAELALDTSEKAVNLIRYYRKRGYEEVARQDWKETNYLSVVLSKQLR